MMRPFYFDPLDPTGQYYYDPLPEHPTKEELDEYQRMTMKMLRNTIIGFFVLLAAFAICSVFSSCATQKQEHQEQTHVVVTDSAATEHSQSVQVSNQTVNIDSIITAVMQRTREEFARQEQEHEIITETLTETVDSLGRVVRQQQKTTDRTLSRQEQQRIERLEQTFEQQIHLAIREHDSIWQDRFAQYEATMRDSLQSMRDMQRQTSATNPLTWWQQFRLHLANIALYALLIIGVIWLIRKKKWLNS